MAQPLSIELEMTVNTTECMICMEMCRINEMVNMHDQGHHQACERCLIKM